MAAQTTLCAESAGGPDRYAELRTDSNQFLNVLSDAVQSGNLSDILDPEYKPVLEMLEGFSRSRGLQGFTPSETATFVFSFKQPLFSALCKSGENDPAELIENMLAADLLLDKLRMLADTSETARVLDAQVVVVGMQPAVTITLVELGLNMRGVHMALDVEKGMEMLRRYISSPNLDEDNGAQV